jgi:HSP20 family molecular chaperone IbpA
MFNPLWIHTDLTRTMEPIFEEFVRQLSAPVASPHRRQIAAFKAKEDGWEAQWTAPGVRAEELDIRAEGGVLHVAYTTAHGEEEGLRLQRKERRVGEVRRKLALPRDADPETISATLRDGLLTISVTALAALMPKKIEVKTA